MSAMVGAPPTRSASWLPRPEAGAPVSGQLVGPPPLPALKPSEPPGPAAHLHEALSSLVLVTGEEEPEEPYRPPLPVEDRLWRHPSEVAAAERAQAPS